MINATLGPKTNQVSFFVEVVNAQASARIRTYFIGCNFYRNEKKVNGANFGNFSQRRTLPAMKLPKDFALRWHSRAGQGAVSAAQFFSEAMIGIGKQSMSFPSFGAEKRGAAVEVFNRTSSEILDDASQPRNVNAVILLEPSLINAELSHKDVLAGLQKTGFLLINAEKNKKSTFHELFGGKIFHVPATKIAFETVGRNVPNVATVGALVKILDLDKKKMRSLLETNLSAAFPEKIVAKNLTGFDRGYEEVVEINGETGNEIPARSASEGAPWKELPQAAILKGGSSKQYKTGNWLPGQRIKFVPENCIQCGICWAVCPDDAIVHDENGQMIGIDQDACKRCGLCVRACSANKMAQGDASKESLLSEDVPLSEQEHF